LNKVPKYQPKSEVFFVNIS